jgi:acyl-[acyl-carrier-protein]-phospholipid O-acyltransferase/long-chain-fatty-acid--[acyl-carrier-protein] ligase
MTVHKPLTLLASRRFGPLFATQFLGAANDNLFKNALIIMVVFRLGQASAIPPAVMVTLAAGVFILPFFLLSATAGQLADAHDKARLIRLVKLAEVALMASAAAGFISESLGLLMVVLFGLGVHSTFFGPLKYAILPDHLEPADLVAGNALIEAGTFLAILIGTIAGGLLILTPHGEWVVSAAGLTVAALGLAASRRIPAAPPAEAGVPVRWNLISETAAIIRLARERRDVHLAILGISWFWLVGATYLSQFPAFAKDHLGAGNQVVTLFLTLFSVGVGLGSLLCARLLKGEISARHVPAAALGIGVFSLDLAWAAAGGEVGPELVGVAEFLARPGNWRIVLDLLAVSVLGGVYCVPLYALVQARSEPGKRARAIAANNVLNAAFMTAASLVTALLLAAGLPVAGVFAVLGTATMAVAVAICGLLPETLLKGLLRRVLRLVFRVEVSGLPHYAGVGERALIVANHVSFLDAVLLAVFLPGRPSFAVNTRIASRWWVAPFMKIVDAVPLDPMNPMAIKALTRAVEQGRHCVIFPEGRITVTGALMKVYDGPGMIADRAAASVVPVRIDGAQYTLFSRLKGKVRRRLFPKIRLTVLPPRRLELPPELKGKARRRAAGVMMYDIMSEMMFATTPLERTLPATLMDIAAAAGAGRRVLEDVDRRPVSYRKVVLGALVLGRRLAGMSAKGECVGVLLPNAVGSVVTLFALQMFGRVPAMLNVTAGAANLNAACTAARIVTVLTSRRFVAVARLEGLVAALGERARIVYLDDLRGEIGALARLRGLLSLPFARRIHARHGGRPNDAAVVLFTSGSEGQPKGVVLSHRNIVANCAQVAARVDFTPADLVFNALPLFHSFGLTGGLLLPLLWGVRVFLYPSPLHYRIVPELVYDTNATIVFGTDTFLAGYARVAHSYDFRSIRYVFTGAEKVRGETRAAWMDKFGLRLLEGYGTTETAPVLAVNTPSHFLAGSVGRLLPGIDWRLEPVAGIEQGGRLHVKGAIVMLGYLKPDRPGDVQPPADGWYDTGDIVTVDDNGFVVIQGRAKRFAKVAGEMVSLGAVEEAVAALWPEGQHAVVALPDPRRGERLVLVTTAAAVDRAALAAGFKARRLSELALPRTILSRDALPLLGTGKTDYITLSRQVADAEA